jgi:pyruvate,water dikinase
VPPAYGVDYRILNGYVFLSPVPAPMEDIEGRVPHFMERAGFYFGNWDRLYDDWLVKIRALVGEMTALEFNALPEMEPMEVITSGKGAGSGRDLMAAYHKLLDSIVTLWRNSSSSTGYAVYLDFGFCRLAQHPDSDRRDGRWRRRDLPSRRTQEPGAPAVSSGIADASPRVMSTPPANHSRRRPGSLTQWDRQQSRGSTSPPVRLLPLQTRLIQNVEVPFGYINNYIAKVQDGQSLDRPVEALHAERDRVVSEYRDLLDSDEDREAFDAKLGLSRVVFPYVENHNFYVEHWAHSVIWRKMRDLGKIFVDAGFIGDVEDVFMLKKYEVADAIYDLYSGWAVGAPSAGPGHWPGIVESRRKTLDALKTWDCPPALGIPPEVVTEPFTVMLWGITSDSVASWLNAGDESGDGSLSGFAASPGLVEGPARVISSADEIADLQDGEILVAPLTARRGAPVFGKVELADDAVLIRRGLVDSPPNHVEWLHGFTDFVCQVG